MATERPPVARTTPPATHPRKAWLAGASGLVGRALLARLLADEHYVQVLAVLRRPVDLPAHPRLVCRQVDFDHLPPLAPVDDVFIALGTTIKAAGSQAAFRKVDFDAVVNTARAGRAAGGRRLLVVSALGADAGSRVFYNRVKGEMEKAVTALGYDTVVLAQPSLLLGDRAALGQPRRLGEAAAQWLLRPGLNLLPRRVRPIAATAVANALHAAAWNATAGVTRLPSARMQQSD
ncbi:MAG: NAD(P)H-binding protein [Burkholderiaceae bacterium]|nr:NAD(P)H-binding protein [Burkholderiaceae bacterium]